MHRPPTRPNRLRARGRRPSGLAGDLPILLLPIRAADATLLQHRRAAVLELRCERYGDDPELVSDVLWEGGSQVAAAGGQQQSSNTQGQQTTPTVQATTDPTSSAGTNTQAGQTVGGVSVANADASKGPW